MVKLLSVLLVFAGVFSPQDINGFVKDFQLVRQAQSAFEGQVCIVAIVSEPIYLKSERIKLVQDLEIAVKEKFGFNEVYVTFDTDVFYRLSKFEKSGDLKEILKLVKSRQSA